MSFDTIKDRDFMLDPSTSADLVRELIANAAVKFEVGDKVVLNKHGREIYKKPMGDAYGVIVDLFECRVMGTMLCNAIIAVAISSEAASFFAIHTAHLEQYHPGKNVLRFWRRK